MAASQEPEVYQVSGASLGDRVRELIHQGNVRHIRIKHEGHPVVEFPVTVGVIGTLLAPQVAAAGALGALLVHCTIEVERHPTPPAPGA